MSVQTSFGAPSFAAQNPELWRSVGATWWAVTSFSLIGTPSSTRADYGLLTFTGFPAPTPLGYTPPTVRINGSGFSYNGTAPTAGVIASLELVDGDGVTVLSRIVPASGISLAAFLNQGSSQQEALLYAGGDTFVGSETNDVFVGGGGADSFSGADGDDFIYAGSVYSLATFAPSGDTVDGGGGVDSVILDYRTATTSLSMSFVTHDTTAGQTLSVGTVLRSIENVAVRGGSAGDTFIGGAGKDTLSGFGGADSLVGGDGDDVLAGLASSSQEGTNGVLQADTLDGGAGTDIAVLGWLYANQALAIDFSAATTALGASIAVSSGFAVVRNVESVVFESGSGSDSLTGTSGNDTLRGGAGDDRLSVQDFGTPSQTGTEIIDGGTGNDLASIFLPTAGTYNFDQIASAGGQTITLAPAAFLQISNMERLAVSLFGNGLFTLSLTPYADVVSGLGMSSSLLSVNAGGGDDSIVGDGLDDTMEGGTGNDTLSAGAGNDVLTGGAGTDRLIGGAGVNSLGGGGGHDRAVYSVAAGVVTITHNADGSRTVSGSGFTDTLSGVETAEFAGGQLVALQERTNRSDLSGDGRSDVLLRNSADGSVYVWEIDGTSLTGAGYVGWTPGALWEARATGDFDGDRKSDVLLQDTTTGQNFIWLANGPGAVGAASNYVGWAPGANWISRGTGDFNGDGKSDILLQDVTNGQCFTFMLDGTTTIGANFIGATVGADWIARGTGDFNGDGKTDILFQDADDGACHIWTLDGAVVTASGQAGWTPGAQWVARGTGDFNGDGKSDILLQDSASGQCFTFMIDGTVAINSGLIGSAVGADWVAKGTGDFNGDGKSDILFQNSGDGATYVWNLDGTSIVNHGYVGWAPGAQWAAMA